MKQKRFPFFWIVLVALHLTIVNTFAESIEGWGLNNFGQIDEFEGSDYIAIAAGLTHSLGLRSDGPIVGKGENLCGQLEVPAPNQDFVAIAADWTNSLGLKVDGSIVARELYTIIPDPIYIYIAVAVSANQHGW